MAIHNYNVIVPPTSGELQERVIEKLKGGLLTVTLLGVQEIPEPQPLEVTFRIAETTHPEEGGMTIGGMVEGDTGSIVVYAPEDPSLPAIASMVV